MFQVTTADIFRVQVQCHTAAISEMLLIDQGHSAFALIAVECFCQLKFITTINILSNSWSCNIMGKDLFCFDTFSWSWVAQQRWTMMQKYSQPEKLLAWTLLNPAPIRFQLW